MHSSWIRSYVCVQFSFVDGFGVDKIEDSGARKILEWAEDYINTQTDVSQPVTIVDVASFDREIDVGVNYDLRLRLGFLVCPKFVLRGSASCKLDEKLPETLCDVGILEDSVSKEKEMTRLLCTNSSRPSKTYLSADASQVASLLPTPPSPSSSVTASEASSVCDEFDSVDIDEVLPSGWTRLHKAAQTGDLARVITLLDCGANPLVYGTAGGGSVPIHEAAFNGRADLVSEFLRRGVDPDVMKKDGWASIHLALVVGIVDPVPVIDALLVNGGDVNLITKDAKLLSPLDVAYERMQTGEVKDYLVKRGGKRSSELKAGETKSLKKN
ncbi:unnamed protein product [Notodromas monacha]|uniref:Uncharacterized protein n=1 Tax=Notodromas monacha TaxID=399045 RepID=A0A7R9BJR2_9CRUS|nr:unnamed protein product [Notodromas monacha]CAG0916791.1 unnamed protein product [Notodromas monacha]